MMVQVTAYTVLDRLVVLATSCESSEDRRQWTRWLLKDVEVAPLKADEQRDMLWLAAMTVVQAFEDDQAVPLPF